MPNIFLSQPEFVPHDIKAGNHFYTPEGMYIRYNHWFPDDQLQSKSVLDIGSHYGQAGAYVLSNGANEYVGVEINDKFLEKSKNFLNKYYKDKNWNILHCSVEEFIKTNNRKFDIVFLGRIVHSIFNNGIDTLIHLAKIADTVIIESGTPLNMSVEKIKQLLGNSVDLSEINKYLEYEHEYIEYPSSTTGDFINTLYSLGFLKMLFGRMGFVCDLEPYESLKLLYPDEYGMGFIGKKGNMIKKFVVRFYRDTSLNTNPLSRVEYEKQQGISNVAV